MLTDFRIRIMRPQPGRLGGRRRFASVHPAITCRTTQAKCMIQVMSAAAQFRAPV